MPPESKLGHVPNRSNTHTAVPSCLSMLKDCLAIQDQQQRTLQLSNIVVNGNANALAIFFINNIHELIEQPHYNEILVLLTKETRTQLEETIQHLTSNNRLLRNEWDGIEESMRG